MINAKDLEYLRTDGLKITHVSHNDMDGNMPIAISKYLLGERIVASYNTSYNGVNKLVWRCLLDKENTIDALIITDISINDPRLITYIEKQTKVKVFLFDHHSTALELNKYSWATVCEDSKCGTKLFWEYMKKSFGIISETYIDNMVELVNDYDTWKWVSTNNQDAVDLAMFSDAVGSEFFVSSVIDEHFTMSNANQKIVNSCKNKLQYIVKPSAERNMAILNISISDINGIGDIEVPVLVTVNGGEFISLVAEHLKKFCDTLIIINGSFMSLRTSRNDIDLAKFASKFGGGGHPQASGCAICKDNYYIVSDYWKTRLEL